MTYNEALKWREDNRHLIGSPDLKGFMVSDLFIVPSVSADRDAFFRDYVFSGDKESAILPFVNRDVEVWSVDLERLESDNILFYNQLAK